MKFKVWNENEPTEPITYFRLVPSVRICTADADGQIRYQVAAITSNGRLELIEKVALSTGLDLDEKGRIRVEGGLGPQVRDKLISLAQRNRAVNSLTILRLLGAVWNFGAAEWTGRRQ